MGDHSADWRGCLEGLAHLGKEARLFPGEEGGQAGAGLS